MIGKKINQLATELAPASTDLTIIGNPTTGVSKKITLAQLGAIFSGAVSFYTNYASFPATGTLDVIFCAKDTQKLYLWSGSAYVEVFPSQALLDTYQLRSEKGNANGYASLDSQGKVPISQLPSSIMEYKGTWNASTNTPTLANGTGDTGDVYICNVAGTVNFGAGPITFAVGDYVIYSGTIWQRSSGAVGTVTSVAASITGDSVTISGSPVTTSGTLAFAFAGNSTQYINGAGNLVTFPGVINEAQNLITEVYNKTGATLTKGTVVYINGGQGNLPAVTKALATGDSTSAQTYGIVRNDITNNNNGYVVVAGRISDLDTQAYTEGTQLYLSPTTAGTFTSTKPYAPQHLVYVGIVVRAHPTQGVVEVKIQNGYELDELHNVAAQTPSNNDGLFWEASTSLWKNKSISTIIGGSPVYGSGTTNYITKWSATSGELINSSLVDIGGTIYNALTNAGQFAWQFNGDTTTGQSYGALINAGTNASDIALRIQNASSTSVYFYVWGDGKVQINNIPNATTDTDKFLVSDSGVIKYRTGAELLSDIGGASASGYVPYTGATANLNLGANDLLSRSVYIEGTASFQAGLLMKQLSVYNFVTGAYTQIAPSTATELNIVHNQANTTRRRYALSVAALQDGDSFQYLVPRKDGTFAMTSDIPSLTGYVQGSGTTNYLPKFTGTSTIGNSAVSDDGTTVTLNSRALSGTSATFSSNVTIQGGNSLIVNNAANTRSGSFYTSADGTEVSSFNGAGEPLLFKSPVGYISMFTNGSERLRILNNGNVGIGTTSADTLLSLVGNHAGGQSILKIQSSTAYSSSGLSSIGFNDSDGSRKAIIYTNTNGLQLETGTATPIIFNPNGTTALTLANGGAATFSSSVTAQTDIISKNNSANVSYLSFQRYSNTQQYTYLVGNAESSGYLAMHTNDTERMRITSGGNVQIGNDSNPFLYIANGGSTDVTSGINWLYGSGLVNGGGIEMAAPSGNNFYMVFKTRNSGSTAERMRISSGGYSKHSNDGNYLNSSASYHELYQSASNAWNTIMTSTSSTSDGIQIRLNSDSTGFTYLAGYSTSASAYRVLIYSNGNISNANNSYGAISDIRLKENVSDTTSKLADLLKVKVRNYNLIGDDKKQLGVIAQELETIFPSMIEVDGKTGMKQVKYSVFVPMLIKAIQELNDKIK